MRNFKELKIWKIGFQIALNSFQITKNFPSSEKYGLASQIRSAAVSIPSNIAEGGSRNSAKDYNRFIEMALGSAFELETQLLIAKSQEFGDQNVIEATLQLLTQEEKMLTSFSLTLTANSKL